MWGLLNKRYGFKKVTRSTLKHLLYEGARLNRVLRINNSWFDKMVDILDIDCESDDGDEDEEEKDFRNTKSWKNMDKLQVHNK